MPIEQQARQASALRNKYRTIAREAMYDRYSAIKLEINNPMKSFDALVSRYSSQGYTGNALYEEIIKASMRTNSEINLLFGVGK